MSPTFPGPDGIAFSYLDEGTGSPFVFQHGLDAFLAARWPSHA